METVLQFTKNIEETLTLQLKNIVETMKQTHLEEAYKGVEEMYDIKPLEGVKYEEYITISVNSIHCTENFYAPCKLPEGEYIIAIHREQDPQQRGCDIVYWCTAITNFGRIIETYPKELWRSNGSQICIRNSIYINSSLFHILKPLPYKIPKILFGMSNIFVNYGHSRFRNLINYSEDAESVINFYENKIPEHILKYQKHIEKKCEEYYMLIGKWQPYIEKNINIDFDKLRENFETQKKNTTQLEIEVKTLLNENNNLKEELDNVKSLYAKLKEDQKDYAELVEWKTTLITHLDDHLDYGCPRKKDGTYLTPNEIGKVLQNYSTIPNNEWEEACEAMDQVEEFKQYQEMQKKFGQFGTTIQNTAIAVKKTKK